MLKNTILKKCFYIFINLMICTGYILLCLALPIIRWYGQTFGVTIKEIIYTINSPLKGADISFIKDAVSYCFPYFVYILISLFVIVALDRICFCGDEAIYHSNKRFSNCHSLYLVLFVVFFASLIAIVYKYADKELKIEEYINNINNPTYIYDEEYVSPKLVEITAPNKKKNLICIYVESLENTYMDIDEGGRQETNYMPNLTQLAKENISLSNNNKIGGFHNTTGTGWTMGSLFASTTGVPFSFPIEGNSMGKHASFAKGITSLGDILYDSGYNNEFLCGSDSEFAGRKDYFTQHGNYEIFDYNTAIEKDYIDKDYFVWWGLEDIKLFDIAKDELIKLSDKDEPFNFTMLTVDLHHVGGYLCEPCKNDYDNRLANVIACNDQCIYDFVVWCKRQDFYKDTVIVIIGDHPRMDNYLVEDVPYYDRTMYNCFINVSKEVKNFNNIEFSPMDLFPTILSALDFEIEGNRLGLGTNLFSQEQTLMQKMTYSRFNDELKKYSEYYVREFS